MAMAADDHAGGATPAFSPSLKLLSDPAGLEAETIRGLRTRVVAQHIQDGRRALAICTPSTGSGCSFVASNLAVAMAQIGIKAVLVDANLRAPGVAGLFGLADGTPGLADYLSGQTNDIDDIVRTDLMPDLGIVTAGTPAANPQELLAGHAFRTLLNQLFREYDLTIFDTPPANTCADAQRVATVAGYSMIVARRHHTFVKDVGTLAKLLRADGSIVIGTVLNEF